MLHQNYGSAEGDGYSTSKSYSKMWLRELKKDYMTQ